MTDTARTVDLEPLERLSEKVKSLIGVLERTREELSQTVKDNQRLHQEVAVLSERIANAESAGAEMNVLVAEREQIRARVHDMLQQLDTLGV